MEDLGKYWIRSASNVTKIKGKMMRVRADMPTIKTGHFTYFVSVIVILAFPTTFGIIEHYHRKSLHEAVPMAGKCMDVPMNRYVGDGDKDGRYCVWHDKAYFCVYDPNKPLWSCDAVK